MTGKRLYKYIQSLLPEKILLLSEKALKVNIF